MMANLMTHFSKDFPQSEARKGLSLKYVVLVPLRRLLQLAKIPHCKCIAITSAKRPLNLWLVEDKTFLSQIGPERIRQDLKVKSHFVLNDFLYLNSKKMSAKMWPT